MAGHIHGEDTILYPWMDRALTTRQMGDLCVACVAVERDFGARPPEQGAFVAELEARYRVQG